MKTTTYLKNRLPKAKERQQAIDFMLDMYLSSAEVERAVLALNLGKGKRCSNEHQK
jgi:hypothetical protein